MDPVRLRSGARFGGLALVLIAFVVLGLMEKTLVGMRRERGGKSAWLGTPNGSPAPLVALVEGGEVPFGENWEGAETADLDGDGSEELLLLERPRDPPAGHTLVARALVLAPRPGARAAVLFDSRWARMTAGLAGVSLWRSRRTTPQSIDLVGLDPESQELDLRLVAQWREREHAFHQRVARVDRGPFATYN